MDSSTLSSQVAEVLSGLPADHSDYSERLDSLHQTLKSAAQASIATALKVAEDLTSQEKLAQSDLESFKLYLKNIKKESSLPMKHLPIVNNGQKAALLCQALAKIHLKSQCQTYFAFNSISLHRVKEEHKLQVKRLNCARLVASLRSSLGMRLQKTVDLLNFESFQKLNIEKKVVESFKQSVKTKTETVTESVVDLSNLKSLADKARLFSDSKRIAVVKWKNKLLRHELESIPKDPVKAEKEKYIKSLLRSVLRYYKSREHECWINWRHKANVGTHQDSMLRVEKLMKALTNGLAFDTSEALRLEPRPNAKVETLEKAFKNVSHQLNLALSKTLTGWNRKVITAKKNQKIKEYLLKNLAKYPKMHFLVYFTTWKDNKKNESPKLFKMVNVLHQLLCIRGRRVFHPPRIIKDADQIMIKSLKDLERIKNGMVKEAVYKWKFFKLMAKCASKRKSVLLVLFSMANPLRKPFNSWKTSSTSDKQVAISIALRNTFTALNRLFRARYRMVVVKALKNKTKKMLSNTVWMNISKVYIEKLRQAYTLWKTILASHKNQGKSQRANFYILRMYDRIQNQQNDLFQRWKKLVESMKKKAYYDSFRTLRIGNILSKLIKSKLANALLSILPNSKIKMMLRMLILSLVGKQRHSVYLWKTWVEIQKQAKQIKQLRVELLAQGLRKLAFNGLDKARDCLLKREKIIGNSLRKMFLCFRASSSPKDAYNRWRLFCIESKHKKQLQGPRSVNMGVLLERVAKRTLVSTRSCISSTQSKFQSIKKTFDMIAKKQKKITVTKWVKYTLRSTTTMLIGGSKGARLDLLMKKVMNRSLKKTIHNIMGGGNRIKGALNSMLHNIKKRPTRALAKWLKFADDCENKTLFDAARSQKLNNALKRVPVRTGKDVVSRVVNNDGAVASKLKLLFSAISNGYKRAFLKWKTFIELVKQKKLMNNLTSNLLLISLGRLPARTLMTSFKRMVHDDKKAGMSYGTKIMMILLPIQRKMLRMTFNRTVGTHDKGKRMIMRVFYLLEKKTQIYYLRWKDYIKQVKEKNMFDNNRTVKMQGSLERVPKMTLKDALDRVLGDGNKAQGTIKRSFMRLLKKPRGAIWKWVKYSQEIDKKNFHDANTSLKLKIAMESIVKRTMRDADRRILGAGDVIKGALRNFIEKLRMIPKDALNKWKNAINDIKNKKLLDNVRSEKLKNALGGIPKRVLRDATQRVVGDGSKLKGALASLLANLKKRPRDAIRLWKQYINDVKSKKLMDNLKSQKLDNILKRIPNRILRDSVRRVIGDGNILKATLNSLIAKVDKRLKDAQDRWRQFIADIKSKKLMDNLKSQKLKNLMERIPRRVIKDAKERVLGDGDKVKGALKTILHTIKNKPRQAYNLWKVFKEACDKKQIMDNVRSQKLLNHLARIPVRSMRDAAQRVLGEGEKVKGALKSIISNLKRKTHDAYNKWKKFIDDIKLKKQIDNTRAQKLKNSLDRIPKRSLKDASERILGDGSKVKGALTSLIHNFRNKLKVSLKLWAGFCKDVKAKNLLDSVKSQKLKNSLSRIPNRTLRDGFQRIVGEGDKLKGALKSLIHNIKKRPKDALEKWRKFVEACNKKSMFDNLRSQKLKHNLTRVPVRTSKDSYNRIIGGGSKAVGALKVIFMALDKVSKQSFFVWRDYVKATKTKEIMTNLTSQKLKNNLTRIPLRTLLAVFRDIHGKTAKMVGEIRGYKLIVGFLNIPKKALRNAMNSIVNKDDRVKAALARIFNFILTSTRRSFLYWNKVVVLIKNENLLDNVKSQKLLNALNRVPKRTLKDAVNRIIGDGDKTQGLIKRAIANILRRPRSAISKWVKYSQEIDKKNFQDANTSLKLKIAMENIVKRTMRDADRRILGAGDVIKGAVRDLIEKLRRKPKDAMNQWKNAINDIKNKKLLDNVRSQKLKNVLTSIPKRTLRDAVQRIVGDGSKLKGAMASLLANLKKRPRDSIRLWKQYINDVKSKKLMDNFKSQKLDNILKRIPNRVLRDSVRRVIGDGNILKATINSLIVKVEKRLKEAQARWRQFIVDIKSKKLMDNLKSQKLKNCMERIPRRIVKDAKERILGDGNKVKGAIKTILNSIKNKPRQAYNLWKVFKEACDKKQIMDNVRSQKLLNHLNRIPVRTMRDTAQRVIGEGEKIKGALKSIISNLKRKNNAAFNTWKKFVDDVKLKKQLDNTRAQKLKNGLERIPKRTLKDTAQRIIGDGSKVKGAINSLLHNLRNKGKGAILQWVKYSRNVDAKNLLDSVKSQKLKNSLARIPVRTLRDGFQRVVGEGDKLKGALKSLIHNIKRRPKDALEKWRNYLEACKQKSLFDNLRSQKLKNSLTRIPVRATRDSFQRVVGGGSKSAAVLKSLFLRLEKQSQLFFYVWRDYVKLCKTKSLMSTLKTSKLSFGLFRILLRTLTDTFIDVSGKNAGILGEVRSYRLLVALSRIDRRTLRIGFNNVIESDDKIRAAMIRIFNFITQTTRRTFVHWSKITILIKSQGLLDGVKSQKLLNALTKVPKRTLKNAFNTVIGDGNASKGLITRAMARILRRPRGAIVKWVKYSQFIDQKKSLDAITSLKLKEAMTNILKRTLRDADQRIIGGGDKIKGHLTNLINSLKRKPKEAINQWKKYIIDIKSKKIMDNLRSQKLKETLARVPRRTMRDAVQRVTGDGSKVKGAMNSLLSNLKKRPRDALTLWKQYVNDSKTRGLLNGLKAQKVKIALIGIVKRTIRDSSQRILGDGNKIKAVFASLEAKVRQRCQSAYNKWLKFLDDIKNKRLMDGLRSEKLKNAMLGIPRRVIKDAKERILGDGNKVKGAIKSILNAVKNKPRQAYNNWKEFVANVKLGKLLSNARNEKFIRVLSNIVKRTLLGSSQRILGDGSKVKGAIKSILNSIKQMNRQAFMKWKKFLDDIKLKKQFDNSRSFRLLSILNRIPVRVTKDTVNRVLGDGDKVKGAVKGILNGFKKKLSQGFSKWKKAVDDMKGKGLLDNLRSQKLKISMSDIIRRTMRDTFHRTTGDGDKIKGALKSILNRLKKLPKVSYDRWKKFVEDCHQKKLFDGLRSHQLKSAISRIPTRCSKDAFQRIAGGGSKGLGAIKSLFMAIDKWPKRAFLIWKDFVNATKTKSLSDIVKSQKLKSSMTRLPARTLRDVFKSVVPEKHSVKGALRGLVYVFTNGLKTSFTTWKSQTKDKLFKATTQQIKAMQLRESLQNPLRKVKRDGFNHIVDKNLNVRASFTMLCNTFANRLRNAFSKWVEFRSLCDRNLVLNALKTQKLKSYLENARLRTLRDACLRVLSFGDKIKGALERLDKTVDRKKNMGLAQWRKFAKAVDDKKFMDCARSLRLIKHMTSIVQRTIRSTSLRIAGAGSAATGLLKNLFSNLEKAPQKAFIKWKEFLNLIKCKKLFDNARSHKLGSKLEAIIKRTISSAMQKFGLDSLNKAKSTLKDMIRRIIDRERDAFYQWKKFVDAVNKKGLVREAVSQKLKSKLSSLASRKMRDAYTRTVGGGDRVAGRFALFNKAIERMKKIAVDNWKNFVNGVKSKKFLDNIRALKLKTAMQGIVKRTSRTLTDHILGDGSKTKGALRRLFMTLDKQTKQAFSTWVNFMYRTKHKNLMNGQRGLALKHHMESIVKRSSKSMLYAVKGVNDKLQLKLKEMAIRAEALLRDAVSKWRKNANELFQKGLQNVIAGERLRRRLEGVSRKTLQVALRRVKDGGSRVSALFKRLLQSYEHKIKESFMRYRLWTLSKSHKLKALTMRLVSIGKVVLVRTLRTALDSMIGDARVRRIITRLVKNYENIQKEVIRKLWHRVEKIRTIKKINSAYFVFRSLLAYAKRVQAVRFKFWKDLEFLRRRRIMRKSTAKMMQMSSVSYESAFWKWKYVLSKTGFQLMPKHSLAFKKMILIGTNYQKRLEQFSFYKLALWYKNMTYGHKMKIPEMVSILNKHSRDLSQEEPDKHPVSVSESAKSVENPSQISTVATGKLSREEVNSINQLGALEMMFTQLKGARIRNLSWGICSVLTYSRQIGFYDNERSRLIDQINELRFEKHSLLEDNNTLRHHNESLIENLEKTNLEFQTLSLHLDQMRLVRMVRVVSKMVEVPMAEAFSYLYENNLDY